MAKHVSDKKEQPASRDRHNAPAVVVVPREREELKLEMEETPRKSDMLSALESWGMEVKEERQQPLEELAYDETLDAPKRAALETIELVEDNTRPDREQLALNIETATGVGRDETLKVTVDQWTKKADNGVSPAIERLRIVLMLFMCIKLFGFPTVLGNTVSTMCGFSTVAFFILSGYLVLKEGEDRPARILRAIRRSAVVFAVLMVVYFLINLLYYRALGVNVFSAFSSKRFWFNFVVMNVWQFDIGGAIWYVQALLYAYIIIWLLNKKDLLRYDWMISLALILLSVLTGELCGLIRWNVAGYTYLPGNFFTRALPYILLGGFLARNEEKLAKIKKWQCWVAGFIGVFMMLFEILMLALLGVVGYYGHLLGMPVLALAICIPAFQKKSSAPGFEMLLVSRQNTNFIYYLCEIVSLLLVLIFSAIGLTTAGIRGCLWLGVFVVCFLLAWLIANIRVKIAAKKPQKANG